MRLTTKHHGALALEAGEIVEEGYAAEQQEAGDAGGDRDRVHGEATLLGPVDVVEVEDQGELVEDQCRPDPVHGRADRPPHHRFDRNRESGDDTLRSGCTAPSRPGSPPRAKLIPARSPSCSPRPSVRRRSRVATASPSTLPGAGSRSSRPSGRHWSSWSRTFTGRATSLLDLMEAMLAAARRRAPADGGARAARAPRPPAELGRGPPKSRDLDRPRSPARCAVTALVRDLLESPEPELVEAVVARAEGNPFYAGRDRALGRRAPRVAARQPDAVPAAIAALPDNVQATVLARLDTLEPDGAAGRSAGAVLGRTFALGRDQALEPALAGEALRTAVGALLDRDFVRPDGADRYAFRHILIREVAYGMLPRSERAALHALAGGWLEGEARRSGREEELAELVAYHYREATTLRAASGEAIDDGLATSAIDWLERAASAALAGAADVEAAHHLQAAAALAPPARRALIEERLGQAWVGGDPALEAFEAAHRLGVETGAGVDQQLRTLSQVGIVLGRWMGSISVRPSDDELHTLVDRDPTPVGRHGAAGARAEPARGVVPDLGRASCEQQPPRDLGRRPRPASGRRRPGGPRVRRARGRQRPDERGARRRCSRRPVR